MTGHRTSRYEALKYAQMLYEKGFRVFYYSQIPQAIKSLKYHKCCISSGYFIKTGNRLDNCRINEYEIPKEIMNFNNPNQAKSIAARWRN